MKCRETGIGLIVSGPNAMFMALPALMSGQWPGGALFAFDRISCSRNRTVSTCAATGARPGSVPSASVERQQTATNFKFQLK